MYCAIFGFFILYYNYPGTGYQGYNTTPVERLVSREDILNIIPPRSLINFLELSLALL